MHTIDSRFPLFCSDKIPWFFHIWRGFSKFPGTISIYISVANTPFDSFTSFVDGDMNSKSTDPLVWLWKKSSWASNTLKIYEWNFPVAQVFCREWSVSIRTKHGLLPVKEYNRVRIRCHSVDTRLQKTYPLHFPSWSLTILILGASGNSSFSVSTFGSSGKFRIIAVRYSIRSI